MGQTARGPGKGLGAARRSKVSAATKIGDLAQGTLIARRYRWFAVAPHQAGDPSAYRWRKARLMAHWRYGRLSTLAVWTVKRTRCCGSPGRHGDGVGAGVGVLGEAVVAMRGAGLRAYERRPDGGLGGRGRGGATRRSPGRPELSVYVRSPGHGSMWALIRRRSPWGGRAVVRYARVGMAGRFRCKWPVTGSGLWTAG